LIKQSFNFARWAFSLLLLAYTYAVILSLFSNTKMVYRSKQMF
jgi:hypothetical protein